MIGLGDVCVMLLLLIVLVFVLVSTSALSFLSRLRDVITNCFKYLTGDVWFAIQVFWIYSFWQTVYQKLFKFILFAPVGMVFLTENGVEMLVVFCWFYSPEFAYLQSSYCEVLQCPLYVWHAYQKTDSHVQIELDVIAPFSRAALLQTNLISDWLQTDAGEMTHFVWPTLCQCDWHGTSKPLSTQFQPFLVFLSIGYV